MFSFGWDFATFFHVFRRPNGCAPCQVSAWFHWLDFIKQQGRFCGKDLLYVGLDETCVRKADAGAGVVVRRSWWKRDARRPGAREQRAACTFICLCSPDTAFQGRLPKIWLGNKYTFLQRSLAECKARKPRRVMLWREKSAWTTKRTMFNVLEAIAASAAEMGAHRQVVLLLDAAPQHIAVEVCREAARLQIWLCFVPANLTFLCQVADTHVFAAMKQTYRHLVQKAKLASNGLVSDAAWFDMMFFISTSFLCGRRWQSAFEANGILGNRSTLSVALQKHGFHNWMTPSVDGAIPRPTQEQLQSLWPQRKLLPYWELLTPLLPCLD